MKTILNKMSAAGMYIKVTQYDKKKHRALVGFSRFYYLVYYLWLCIYMTTFFLVASAYN